MASVENTEGRLEAKANGWRTYRVSDGYEDIDPAERICPNDSHGVKCINCMACHGKGNRADIIIDVHGSWQNRYVG